MPFGIIGRAGPGIRQVLGFDNRSTGKVLLRANLGRAIVTNGDFTGSVCNSASTVGAAIWGGACGGPRHCCTLDAGQRSTTGRGRFFGGGFVLHFHNGKCHWVADREMFPIRMRKVCNISVRQTYRWKARFVRFLAIYSVSPSKSGFMRHSQNRNTFSANTRFPAAKFQPVLPWHALPHAYRICSNASRGLLLQLIRY